MKIICEFGFYKFFPESVTDLMLFKAATGKTLVKVEDFYTYSALAALGDYSIKGQDFGGVTAIVSFEGKPWEVFRQNALNYDVDSDKIEKAYSKSRIVNESMDGYFWSVTGIPRSHAQLADKTRITGFEGFIDVKRNYTIIIRWQNENY